MTGTAFDRLCEIGALREIELFRAIWENFPENMFVIRVEGDGDAFIVEAFNPAQAETLGNVREGVSIAQLLPSPTAERVHTRYRECLEKGAPVRYEEQGVSFIDHAGETRTGSWLTLLMPLHDAGGRISHLFGISQNITELRLARNELERKNQELEERVEERTAELRQANEQLQALNARLETLATRDFLTGVHNRRNLERLVGHELSRADRADRPLAVLMLDLDHFKAINDAQGHTAGDSLLKQVAVVMQASLRDVDLLGRYGGDEFVIILPDTGAEEAVRVAERIRSTVLAATGMTVSIGLAQSRPGDTGLGDLALRADTPLLQAKRSGRNALQAADT